MDPSLPQSPPPLEDEEQVIAWGLQENTGKHVPIKINRPKIAPMQVKFEMLYCGICHSDCHWGRGELAPVQMPFVAGHELLGKVTEIGEGVTKVKVGDTVAVGCFIEACLDCEYCKAGDEQYCDKGMTMTYAGQKQYGQALGNKETTTQGGYSESHTVHEHFVVSIPEGMDLSKTAPILCAGITLYDPLRHWGFANTTGKTVGIAGIGGLGTMGIKIAKAMGHKVIAMSNTPSKEAIAKEKGADVFVVMSDEESVKANAATCDIILHTVSSNYNFDIYLGLLRTNGVMVGLGLAPNPLPVAQTSLMFKRKTFAGSIVGGMAATQECVDFCFKHKVYPDCETVTADKISDCWEKLEGGLNKDGVRYVIDIKKSLQSDFVPK